MHLWQIMLPLPALHTKKFVSRGSLAGITSQVVGQSGRLFKLNDQGAELALLTRPAMATVPPALNGCVFLSNFSFLLFTCTYF